MGFDISDRKEDRLSDFHGIAVMKQGNHVVFGLNLFDQPFYLHLPACAIAWPYFYH